MFCISTYKHFLIKLHVRIVYNYYPNDSDFQVILVLGIYFHLSWEYVHFSLRKDFLPHGYSDNITVTEDSCLSCSVIEVVELKLEFRLSIT